ncbi:heterokaryon incompatibility protein-domain-containing protein [Xylaria telfairii]|nr:heterokaryon incompatibility protein-domain-containing protein [Xylaria telfairii]
MRLIQCDALQLRDFPRSETPPYAILSHTWQDEEVTFTEFSQGAPVGTEAAPDRWEKITQTCKLAIAQGYEYVWIDTCCIDKSSSAELTEAINSMYAWYAESAVCFAYLSDFDPSRTSGPYDTRRQFSSSRWFSRGWTLQELIAPGRLEFYDSSWTLYGSKAILCADIAYTTGIDKMVLCAASDVLQNLLASIPVCQKMSWAAGRKTQRPEDVAYSLLGIFGVHMPLIYGEGINAFARLQKKIIKSTNDLTIFAWTMGSKGFSSNWDYSVLASSPENFAGSQDIVFSQNLIYNPDFSITNKGIQITGAFSVGDDIKRLFMALHCHHKNRPQESLGIYLGELGAQVYYRRYADTIPLGRQRLCKTSIFLNIRPQITPLTPVDQNGFNFIFKDPHSTSNVHIRHLSTYPEKRWRNDRFYVVDALLFIGINMYQASWEDKTARFVVACGFDLDDEPWACINGEGSDLWYAAMQHDSMRVRQLSQDDIRVQVVLEDQVLMNVEATPFSDGPGQYKFNHLIQVFIHADRVRR